MSPEPADRTVPIPPAFQVVGEQYRLTRKIGEGSFGVVYEARHELLGQDFAVKILKPELCEDQNLRERFLDEARALVRFSHPNVVQLRHVGEQGGRLYLVMDFARGEALGDLLRRTGPLPEARAVDLTLQVLGGLEAAHAAGIVHRDLKPSNLIVSPGDDGRDHVRILDFGLARLSSTGGAPAHRSVTGAIIGTLAYMSPEQLQGDKDIDARSDVFAAGLLLYEMLEGKHPYPDESGIMVAARLLREPVPDLDPRRAARLADATKSALRQALERDRDARFSSAFAFAQALEGRGPPTDTSRVTTIQNAREALARAEARRAAAGSGRRARTAARFVLLALLLALAGAGAWFLVRGKGSGGEDSSSARGPEAGPAPQPAPPPAPPPTPPGPPLPGPVPPGPPPPTPPVPDLPAPGPAPAVVPAVIPTESVPPGPGAAETAPPPPPGTSPPVAPGTPPPVAPPPAEPTRATPPPTTGLPADASRADLRGAAAERAAAGAWSQARDLYRRAMEVDPLSADAVGDLRGAAATGLAAAGTLGRHGKVAEAIAEAGSLAEWIGKVTKEVYEPASARDRDALRLHVGFAHTHRGEALVERARWLRVQGNPQAADEALAQAKAELELGWPYLDRDGENWWDFLLRRAELHRFQGEFREGLEDLALTTQVNSEMVPTRMWVAHFTGMRRQVERLLLGGRGPGAPEGRPARPARAGEVAEKVARDALLLVRSGESWTRRRGEIFDRGQWIEACRVILANDMALPDDEDRTPLNGLLQWYLEQARAQPAPPWEPADLARARLLPLEAGLALLESRVATRRGKAADAAAKQAEALRIAREAVDLRERIAAAGGELPEGFPYELLAHALKVANQRPAALDAVQRGRQAASRNPE